VSLSTLTASDSAIAACRACIGQKQFHNCAREVHTQLLCQCTLPLFCTSIFSSSEPGPEEAQGSRTGAVLGDTTFVQQGATSAQQINEVQA